VRFNRQAYESVFNVTGLDNRLPAVFIRAGFLKRRISAAGVAPLKRWMVSSSAFDRRRILYIGLQGMDLAWCRKIIHAQYITAAGYRRVLSGREGPYLALALFAAPTEGDLPVVDVSHRRDRLLGQ
jgi:hypothetical protein